MMYFTKIVILIGKVIVMEYQRPNEWKAKHLVSAE